MLERVDKRGLGLVLLLTKVLSWSKLFASDDDDDDDNDDDDDDGDDDDDLSAASVIDESLSVVLSKVFMSTHMRT